MKKFFHGFSIIQTLVFALSAVILMAATIGAEARDGRPASKETYERYSAQQKAKSPDSYYEKGLRFERSSPGKGRMVFDGPGREVKAWGKNSKTGKSGFFTYREKVPAKYAPSPALPKKQ